MKSLILSASLAVMLLLASGCSSERVMITPGPLDTYQKLGHVEGKSCGALGLLATAYYFIPMGLNGRYEAAYKDAIAKAPGATGLIDVTISEDWWWWLLVTARCVTLSGEAIK